MNRIYRVVIGLVAVTALIGSSAQTNDSALRDRAIGYVMTDLFWSVYQTSDAKQECPRGFNDGPREQFEQLYPYHEGLTVEETQLKQEIETWHPSTEPDGFEFLEVEGEFSWGLNLDGEVGPNDFVHPDGSPGIDNEVYRAVGCVIGFRGPDGVEFIFQNKAIVDERYNRLMVELTEVETGLRKSTLPAPRPTAQDDEDYTPIRLTDPIPESARIQDPSSGKSDQEQLKDKVSTLLSESEKHPSDEDDPFSTNLD